MQRYLLWCGYAGSSLEVKIETDSNDAMEIKTEADSNDIMPNSVSIVQGFLLEWGRIFPRFH